MSIRQEFQAHLESKTKEELIEGVKDLLQDHTRLKGIIQAQGELIQLLGNAMADADDADDIGVEASAHLQAVTEPATRLIFFIEALVTNDPRSGVTVGFADEGPEGSVKISPLQNHDIVAILSGIDKEVQTPVQ